MEEEAQQPTQQTCLASLERASPPPDSKSRDGSPCGDPLQPPATPEAGVVTSGEGAVPVATWRASYEHPLAAATSAMLNISPEDQQHVMYDYTYRTTAPVSSAPGQLITSQSKIGDELVAASGELGLLLTSADDVKREAEDLTARRSPSELRAPPPPPEDRRVVIVNGALELAGGKEAAAGGVVSGAVSPERYTVQQPVALLHSDSPSPKDMTAAGHYTAQYSSLAPAQVFTEPLSQYSAMPPSPTSGYAGAAAPPRTTAVQYVDPSYYRDYYTTGEQYTATRAAPVYTDNAQEPHAQFVERYIRPPTAASYKLPGQGLAVDLPSPDSGIGAEAASTPRDQPVSLQQSTGGFEYADMCGQPAILTADPSLVRPGSATPSTVSRSRPWHDFGRQAEVDKIHIPKLFSNYGFRFFLETPISTSQRREDDRLTYVNKGQFYGVTMEYVPDPDKPLKNTTVKSVVLLVFREEKSPEDEMKAWQFWHSRQHSVKQRILDVDTKNSIGLYGGIDELSHNAIAVYWNPLEGAGKINIAVQCLSTDFSSQKGVKGLPLHIQIDTYEDYRDPNATVSHRAYVQVKSFCDKGAERKTRDEERRASKRKMTATGRKKMEEMYHASCERSEFYSMADTTKPATLFQPSDDPEKIGNMELQNYYAQQDSESSLCNEVGGDSPAPPLLPAPPPVNPVSLKFHYNFPPHPAEAVEGERVKEEEGLFSQTAKRARLSPPLSQRVMLYVRQEREELYTPLHVVPPTAVGLLHAIEAKYKINASCVQTLCRRNKKGVTATMDDDMIALYCNEDTFLLEIRQSEQEGAYDITLIEVGD